ncbi:MAG: LeuA family protein [Trebonia sp.]
MPEQRQVTVFDSTLRDGEQAPGNSMMPEDKLALALAMEDVGVDIIEAGFPGSSPQDFKATQLIARSLRTAKLATLSRAVAADIECAAQAGGVERHHLQVMVTGSDFHLTHKRRISRQQGLDEAVSSIGYARRLGFDDISLAIEDASRGTDDLLRPLVEASVENGAGTVVLADTTGRMLPGQFGDMVRRVRGWVPAAVRISAHCHDDLGLSLANALAGAAAGADMIQTTIGGIGERAGNTPLEELAAVLHYKGSDLGLSCGIRTRALNELFSLLRETIDLPPQRNKAIVGEHAFSTRSGVHQASLLKAPATYEYVEAELFGRERRILVGRHSGRSILRHILDQAGITPEPDLVSWLYETFIVSRDEDEPLTVEQLADAVQIAAKKWHKPEGK